VARATLRLIDRGDLLAALDRAAAKKVTIISAPAGSGKTSLLRAWAGRPDQPRRLAVVQVQRGQQDAQQFWLALLSAVRNASGTTSGAEPPAATPDFNGRAMVDRVFSELADARDGITLVVDDLHELNSPEALAQLTRLLSSLPPNGHAILTTRHDLPLRLHQLRLAGELAEIRAADLRFTERETRELLDASGIALSEAGAALLQQRTEGWAAGLRLAVISLAGHPDPERFVTEFSGSDHMVTEYLLAEMLDRQPADVQDLLLRTSLLDRVNSELADVLTGRPGSEGILLELEDANAFVVSLDPGRTSFRYHHLFADLLRLELRRRLPEEVPELHRRAAQWFTQHGEVAEAIRHIQAAGDWQDAARLLADHSFSLMLDGQAQTMQALLRAFPPGADRPGLALVRATVDIAQGRLDEAAAHLAVAEAHAGTAPPDRRRRLQMAIAALNLSLAGRRGNFASVVEQARFLASPLTGPSAEDIALGSDLRAVALMNLGIVEEWSQGLPDGERHLQEGAALAREIGRPYLEVACLAQLGFASKFRPFAVTRRRCREAVALADRYGWGADPIAAPALVTLAANLAWTGEFDEAERWLQRTTRAVQTDTGPGIRMLTHIVAGFLLAGRGRHHEALEEFRAAERPRAQLDGSHALANQATSWMLATQARAGLPGEARAALAALDEEKARSGEVHNADAVICLAEGEPAAALSAVASVLDGTAPVIGYTTVMEAHLLAGLAHRQLGDQRAANGAAEHALTIAEQDRVVLPFVMTGSAELLETLPRHQTAHAALLADILDLVHGSSLAAKGQSASQLTEELSPGELRVMRYLPTNLSRSEIAGELFVSPHTVNTHIRSIYAKLGVADRTAAVRRARELRLRSGPQLEFGLEFRPDLRHLVSDRRIGIRVPGVDRVERGDQDRGGSQPGEPLVVGRDDVPGSPLGAGVAQHLLEGPLVVVPVAPLPNIGGRELPVLLRVVDALEEPLGLLPLGQVQHDLDDVDAVVDQVALPVVDLPVPPGPDVTRSSGHLLGGEQGGVHPDDQHLLVVGPVEDAEPAPAGQGALAPPEKVVVQLLGRGLLERPDLHPLRVDPVHHVLDRAVLARRVDALQHQQHAERVLGRQPVLVIGQQLHTLGQQRSSLRPGHLAGVARVVVAVQLDLAARRDAQRCDEVGHEANALVHVSAPTTAGPRPPPREAPPRHAAPGDAPPEARAAERADHRATRPSRSRGTAPR
jgi:LuxR family transcriptional regulator, maltose regulon positive regulatory protein